MVKQITCTICPLSCDIVLEIGEDGNIYSLTGNKCARGEAYATKEHTSPERTLTTTVAIKGALHPLLPVRTDKPIPKAMMLDAMEAVRKLEVEAPVRMGDCIAQRLLGLEVNLIATRNLD